MGMLSLLSCARRMRMCWRHWNACESDWWRLPRNAEAAAVGGELGRPWDGHWGCGLVSVVGVHEVEGGGS